jgi:multicomponent Na+:H+ antiporter subunit D
MTVAGTLVVAPFVFALGAVVATLLVRRRPRLQRAVSVAGALAYAAAVAALTWTVVLAPGAPGGAVYQVGGWPAPFGITLVADALSTFFLALAAGVSLAAVVFSVLFVDADNQRVFYHPLFHALGLGVTGALLTGDLFNLFVWFEVMLMASYVFVAFYGGARHTAAALRYLVLNVVGGVLMLLGIGGLYATTGTLNMADMARRLADPVAFGIDVAPVVGLAGLLFVAFALKAGLVPFQFWVPGAYEAAPLPVTAMLAGVSKKVGLYALIRLYFTVFDAAAVGSGLPGVAGTSPLALFGPVLFAMAVASIAVGGLGAVARDSIEGVLAYSSIGQVGFVALPIAIAATAATGTHRHVALLSALVFALHHALAKSTLFLAAASVRDATGTNRLRDLGGLAGHSPVLGATFFVGSLALVGVPPLSGFLGKLLVVDAAVAGLATPGRLGATLALLAVFAGSLLTIAYTTRVWTGAFWDVRPEPAVYDAVDRTQLLVLATMAAVIVAVGVGFEPVADVATAAAEAALDREGYVDLVDLGGDGP